MSAEIHDYRAVFELKRTMAEYHRRRRGERPAAHYEVLMLRDLSVGELVHALRGTGLLVSTEHGQTVVHRDPTPPGDAA